MIRGVERGGLLVSPAALLFTLQGAGTRKKKDRRFNLCGSRARAHHESVKQWRGTIKRRLPAR